MRKPVIYEIVAFSLLFIFTAIPSHARNMNILVQPFEYKGDPQYSWISSGMTDTVISDLNKIKDIYVISDKDRKQVLEELKFTHSGLVSEETIVKIGKMTGANIIFTGSSQVSGNRIRVNAKLINVENGKVESSTKLDGTLDSIFDLQDKVVFSLMGETEKVNIIDIEPVKLALEDKKKIEEKYRPKTKAYEWYSKGLEVTDKNPKLALDYFNRAIKIDPNYVDPLIEAGYVAGDTLSLFDESQNYLEKADRIFVSRGDTSSSDYSVLMRKIGTIYFDKGELDSALKYYEDSLAIRDRLSLQNTAEYSHIMMNIGNIYAMKGQLDTALKYYEDAQVINDRLGLQNTTRYPTVMMNIGNIYAMKGQLDTALKYYLDSQSIKDGLGLQNTAGYCSLIMNIGNIYLNKGQFDLALKYYRNSQAISYRLGLQNTADYSTLMMNIGLVYSNKGQLDLALKHYRSSQAVKDRLGLQNTADYGLLLFNFALAYEKQDQQNMAGKYFRMAYDTYIKADYSGPFKDKAFENAVRLGH